jgi:hypothetical protein
MTIYVESEDFAIGLASDFMRIARVLKERCRFYDSLEEQTILDTLYKMRDSIKVIQTERHRHEN